VTLQPHNISTEEQNCLSQNVTSKMAHKLGLQQIPTS